MAAPLGSVVRSPALRAVGKLWGVSPLAGTGQRLWVCQEPTGDPGCSVCSVSPGSSQGMCPGRNPSVWSPPAGHRVFAFEVHFGSSHRQEQQKLPAGKARAALGNNVGFRDMATVLRFLSFWFFFLEM